MKKIIENIKIIIPLYKDYRLEYNTYYNEMKAWIK